MIPKSIRWRLPLSYAAIALLAALALGVVLLTTLRSYYIQRELDYLNRNAQAISLAVLYLLESDPSPEALEARLRSFSFLSQTRVRLMDETGAVVADSLSPQQQRKRVALYSVGPPPGIWQEDESPGTYQIEIKGQQIPFDPELVHEIQSPPSSLDRNQGVETKREDIIIMIDDNAQQRLITRTLVVTREDSPTTTHTSAHMPVAASGQPITDTLKPVFFTVAGTPYGFDLNAELADDNQRSDQSVQYAFHDVEGNLKTIELSEGPAYGRQILNSVARGWAIASGVAVVLAAATGWLISRQLSIPLLALTEITTQMAEGDLSVRADLSRRDELGRLAGSFNNMAAQVEEKVITLRRFVADAAHELHTPLTALRTDLELIAGEPADTNRRAFIARAQSQVERLRALTAGLLELSRLEAGPAASDYTVLDFADLIRATSEPYASQAEQAGLTFTLNLATEPVTIPGNKTQLQMTLGNLLDNALKFTPQGGQITVSLQAQPVWVELKIEDTGIGIPPEDVPQLFSRFHRGRNAAAYPGSGLGLAIVKAIVEGHSGQVRAEQTGRGRGLWCGCLRRIDYYWSRGFSRYSRLSVTL